MCASPSDEITCLSSYNKTTALQNGYLSEECSSKPKRSASVLTHSFFLINCSIRNERVLYLYIAFIFMFSALSILRIVCK